MWNKKVEVIPVIISVTGLVEKNLKKYLGRIPGHHNVIRWLSHENLNKTNANA